MKQESGWAWAALLAVLSTSFFETRAVAAAPKPTAAEAAAFVAKAEADLAAATDFLARAEWVQETDINVDTNWLHARADSELTDLSVRYAKEAARYDQTTVDPVIRRKLHLLTQSLVMPAPSRPGASQELSEIEERISTRYSTSKFDDKGRVLTLDEMADVLRSSRDPQESKRLWEGWRAVSSPSMKADYARQVELANEGARELGYEDTGALWRSWYDMPPQAFAAQVDTIWERVRPLYSKLHCYARAQLHRYYGSTVQPATGPIRADLLGNMWSQSWGNVYDIMAPRNVSLGYDLTSALKSHGFDAGKIVRTADDWYQSIGLAPEPATFWQRSMFTRPRDREVVCHPSASDVDSKEDLRIKVCLTGTADDFYTAHHELGHNMYQRAYQNQPYLFQSGANDGFHEAIGDFAGLNAVAPGYLVKLGLIDSVPGADADIPFLLRVALDKVAVIPFAIVMDKWRWGVFSGEIKSDHYNDAWWNLVSAYQRVAPPGPRPPDAFDPGAKYHIADNTPYARYLLAAIYEFQFYRAACRMAGWKGPLHRCSVYGNHEVGARLDAMLRLGQSKPWADALETFSGERSIDAGALTDYFAPLSAWLDRQNRGQACNL